MAKQKGFILYEGASELDNAPIVVIATMSTNNRKTGKMVQVWILRSDIDPIEAFKSKADYSICGNCPQRWSLGGACYVNIGQAPSLSIEHTSAAAIRYSIRHYMATYWLIVKSD
jgi:hypothetical protein